MKLVFAIVASAALVDPTASVKVAQANLAQLESSTQAEGIMPGAGTQNSPTINIIDNNRNMSTNTGGGGSGGGQSGSPFSCGDGFPFNLVQTTPAMQSILPGGQPVNPINMMSLPMNMQNMMMGMREQGCLPVEMPHKQPKQFSRAPMLQMLP